jgi:hypothetical protein
MVELCNKNAVSRPTFDEVALVPNFLGSENFGKSSGPFDQSENLEGGGCVAFWFGRWHFP